MISLTATIELLFRNGSYDGVYIQNCPTLVHELKQFPAEVVIEELSNELVRAWTIKGYEEHIKYTPPVNSAMELKRIQSQMILAIESADINKILLLRKQIKELNL